MKVRKLPVTVDAWRIPVRGEDVDPEFRDLVTAREYQWDEDGVLIPTLEGYMLGRPGDYLIRGVNSECYPCKPDIFAKTYEVVE